MESEGEDVPETNLSNSNDEVDYPPNNYVYRWIDLVFLTCGMITFCLDLCLDVMTACTHWYHKDYIWFTLTTIFITFPSLVMTTVSLWWYIKDEHNGHLPRTSASRWVLRICLNVLQLGPLLRYIDAARYGLWSRKFWIQGDRRRQKQYYTYALYEEGDAGFLRLFECFMESAPQLVLQLYILTQASKSGDYSKTWKILLVCGCVTSLLSLAWGVTGYARTTRYTSEKENITLKGTVVLFLWHLSSIAARVVAMVAFAAVFRQWLLVGGAAHVLLMVVWLMTRRSLSTVCPYLPLELLFCCILAVVYIFVFINEKEEKTRGKYAWWYMVCAVENVAMIVCWLVYADPTLWYYTPAAVVHFVSFLLGLIFMGLYYSMLHPNVINSHIVPRIEQQQQKIEVPTNNVMGEKVDL
ncbi:hypothetical protein Pcinc_014743 [Petrolisthes cinctipes]|uniref:XK-related protein n=1 Tax=Petrolisthes cinctipes TaxID=88211 RepID=A0AAE1KNW9_PETCI|nr:hypothetical protein Pcinc_014743 [Petrolisthes cinctipes]